MPYTASRVIKMSLGLKSNNPELKGRRQIEKVKKLQNLTEEKN